MPTLETEQLPSPQHLLQEIARLSPSDLDNLLDKAMTLRAARCAPHLSQEETQLLEIINAGFSPDVQTRFSHLVTKRRANKITRKELSELIALTEQSEIQDAKCVRAATELARLRGISFDELWRQLKA